MNKKDRLFLKENYGRLSNKYIAKRLGLSPAELQHEAFLYGLPDKANLPRRKPPPEAKAPVPLSGRKAEKSPNPDMRPLRIDARTIILIPPDADPEERRRRFLDRTTTHPPKRGVAMKKS